MSRCTLVMDATGVGAPVHDLMRVAGLGCGIVPVNLTGGDLVSQSGSLWNVPKQVLISGLLVMLEKKELALSMRVALDDVALCRGRAPLWQLVPCNLLHRARLAELGIVRYANRF